MNSDESQTRVHRLKTRLTGWFVNSDVPSGGEWIETPNGPIFILDNPAKLTKDEIRRREEEGFTRE